MNFYSAIKKPDAVIFDWDNTLVDSLGYISKTLNDTLMYFGHNAIPINELRSYFLTGSTMKSFVEKIFGENKLPAIVTKYREFYKYGKMGHIFSIYTGVVDLLENLNNSKIPLFVVSNKNGDDLRVEANQMMLDKYFVKIVGANDTENIKPNREPVEYVLKGSDINLQNNHIWFIGDSMTDIECAINCGCFPILFGKGNKLAKEQLLSAQHKDILIIDDYDLLGNLIKNDFKNNAHD